MCHLCNDSKLTLKYKQVTGLVVLAQHHIGVTVQFVRTTLPLKFLLPKIKLYDY